MCEKVFSRIANLHRDSSQYKFTADHQNLKFTLQLKNGSLIKQIIFKKCILHCTTVISEWCFMNKCSKPEGLGLKNDPTVFSFPKFPTVALHIWTCLPGIITTILLIW